VYTRHSNYIFFVILLLFSYTRARVGTGRECECCPSDSFLGLRDAAGARKKAPSHPRRIERYWVNRQKTDPGARDVIHLYVEKWTIAKNDILRRADRLKYNIFNERRSFARRRRYIQRARSSKRCAPTTAVFFSTNFVTLTSNNSTQTSRPFRLYVTT